MALVQLVTRVASGKLGLGWNAELWKIFSPNAGEEGLAGFCSSRAVSSTKTVALFPAE